AVQEPHVAVGTDAGAEDAALRVIDRFGGRGGEVVAEQPVTALVRVHEQERAGVGPPVRDGDVAGQVEIDVVPGAGGHVPHAGAFDAGALGDDGQAVVF